MWTIFFEILAVAFGTAALFTPKICNPSIKFTEFMVSESTTIGNCKNVYRLFLAFCFITNTIALYFYIGSLGLLFSISLIAILTSYKSRIHLVTAFIAFLLYSCSSVIYNPSIFFNYLPIFGLILAVITYITYKTNSLGLTLLTYSAATLMIINALGII